MKQEETGGNRMFNGCSTVVHQLQQEPWKEMAALAALAAALNPKTGDACGSCWRSMRRADCCWTCPSALESVTQFDASGC